MSDSSNIRHTDTCNQITNESNIISPEKLKIDADKMQRITCRPDEIFPQPNICQKNVDTIMGNRPYDKNINPSENLVSTTDTDCSDESGTGLERVVRSKTPNFESEEEMQIEKFSGLRLQSDERSSEQNLNPNNTNSISQEQSDRSSGDEAKSRKDSKATPTMDEIIEGINSCDHSRLYSSVQAIRKISHKEKNKLIEAGTVPKLVECLSSSDTNLQFESAWALTNIASGTSQDTMAVVNAGAIPILIENLKSQEHVSEQAAWALGNIAGDGSFTRNLVLEHGAMTPLLSLIKVDTKITALRTIVWTISNFCRFKDPPNFSIFKPCLWYLKSLMYHYDTDVLTHACWALAYVSDGSNDKIQAVIDTGIVPRLVELLGADDTAILSPTIRTVGNIVTGNDVQTERFITAGGILRLERLLQHENKRIVKETVWTISNLLAGNVDQIQKVINAGLIPHLIKILRNGETRSRREAAWAISNLTAGGIVQQVTYLIKCGIVQAMCENLDSKENEIVTVTLDGLIHILQAAEQIRKDHEVAVMIKVGGGLNKLKQLKRNFKKHEPNYDKIKKIINKYFLDILKIS